MEQAVKQRLVGAAVLTALAIIALPVMFDLERPTPIRVTEVMPPQPQLPAVQHQLPTPATPLQADPVPVSEMYALNGEAAAVPPPAGESAETPVSESSAAAPSETPVANPAKPAPQLPAPQLKPTEPLPPVPPAPGGKLDANGVPEAWVVQVAAMSDQAKADVMIKQLKAKGFAAFSVAGKTSKGSAVRVFIGPKLDKAAAIKVKQSVDKAMGLQTMVVPFTAR